MEDERLASLKAMEAFTGTEIQIRKFVNDWILLTYDLPHSEEGDKARAQFLKQAARIGAAQHTESVYLLPWTPEAESIALDVAAVGHAFLWISKVKDEAIAISLTGKYDRDIAEFIKELKDRLNRIEKHWQDGKEKLARRMMKKTWEKVESLQAAIVRRGSIRLHEGMKPVVAKLRDLEQLQPAPKPKKAPEMTYDVKSKRFVRV